MIKTIINFFNNDTVHRYERDCISSDTLTIIDTEKINHIMKDGSKTDITMNLNKCEICGRCIWSIDKQKLFSDRNKNDYFPNL